MYERYATMITIWQGFPTARLLASRMRSLSMLCENEATITEARSWCGEFGAEENCEAAADVWSENCTDFETLHRAGWAGMETAAQRPHSHSPQHSRSLHC